jgi:hypothetical protein
MKKRDLHGHQHDEARGSEKKNVEERSSQGKAFLLLRVFFLTMA